MLTFIVLSFRTDILRFNKQLKFILYIHIRSNHAFFNIKKICQFAKKLIETKNIVYLLVFLLVKLALIFHVTAANVEKAFQR